MPIKLPDGKVIAFGATVAIKASEGHFRAVYYDKTECRYMVVSHATVGSFVDADPDKIIDFMEIENNKDKRIKRAS